MAKKMMGVLLVVLMVAGVAFAAVTTTVSDAKMQLQATVAALEAHKLTATDILNGKSTDADKVTAFDQATEIVATSPVTVTLTNAAGNQTVAYYNYKSNSKYSIAVKLQVAALKNKDNNYINYTIGNGTTTVVTNNDTSVEFADFLTATRTSASLATVYSSPVVFSMTAAQETAKNAVPAGDYLADLTFVVTTN